MLDSDNGNKNEEAKRELLAAAKRYMGSYPHDPKVHRYPAATEGTWNREAIGLALRNIRNNKLPSFIAADSPTNRVPVAIGLRLGTGFGKTHDILTEAPGILGVSSSVYITYNQPQLGKDKEEETTRKATFLRLILASHGCSSLACAIFFRIQLRRSSSKLRL